MLVNRKFYKTGKIIRIRKLINFGISFVSSFINYVNGFWFLCLVLCIIKTKRISCSRSAFAITKFPSTTFITKFSSTTFSTCFVPVTGMFLFGGSKSKSNSLLSISIKIYYSFNYNYQILHFHRVLCKRSGWNEPGLSRWRAAP